MQAMGYNTPYNQTAPEDPNTRLRYVSRKVLLFIRLSSYACTRSDSRLPTYKCLLTGAWVRYCSLCNAQSANYACMCHVRGAGVFLQVWKINANVLHGTLQQLQGYIVAKKVVV